MNSIYFWNPKAHMRYKLYSFMLKIPLGKRWQRYWCCKKCNFKHKPFIDGLKALNRKYGNPLDKIDYGSIEIEDFTWEVITNTKSNS